MKDPILGGKLIHGKTRIKKLDDLLSRIAAFQLRGLQMDSIYYKVYEARQLEAARVGKKFSPVV